MSSWQKRARIGVAIFGIAVAAVVYFTVRERETVAPPAPVQRTDPKAIAEISGGDLGRHALVQENFKVEYSQFRVYDDGSTQFDDVLVTVPKGENRTFTVAARAAHSGKGEANLELKGAVKLQDSDGFNLTTEQGSYQQTDQIASAPGAVTFARGRMSGSGVAISYDQKHDLLVIGSDAKITTTDAAGSTFMEFTAGSARLDRVSHILTLEGSVHIVRGPQIIEADHVMALLNDKDEVVTYMELRGNARVEGGDSSLDAMSARDINLHYTDDGTRLELVQTYGTSAMAMTGRDGGGGRQILAELISLELAADGAGHMVLSGKASVVDAGEGGRPGRTVAAESLVIDVGPDGTLTRMVGRDNARLDLPSDAGGPVRSIRTKLIDGHGVAGKGLTSATFTGDVVYREQGTKGVAEKTARAQKLEAAMNGDAVNSATFTGDVTFEETGLKACAGRLEYQPDKGSLALSGMTGGNIPTVAEELVNIEAPTISVSLQGRQIVARGTFPLVQVPGSGVPGSGVPGSGVPGSGVPEVVWVTTRMGSATRCMPSTPRPAAARGATRLPGMLDPKAAVVIKALELDYQGAKGRAVYSGSATSKALLTQQSGTSIYAERIVIDQMNGDLTATGNSVVSMPIDGKSSTGRAHEIRYVDRTRTLTYAAPPTGYVAPAPIPGVQTFTLPTLDGPQGFLTAGTRISVVLAKEGARAERLEARTNVALRQTVADQDRTVNGGASLTYSAATMEYVMQAEGATPVRVVDKSGNSCREIIGRKLTFFESGANITVDGEQRNRTQFAPSVCPAR